MVKYLKKIGILSLLISIAINNNFKAMNEIRIDPDIKIEPIIRMEEHLKDCSEIAGFEKDIESLKKYLALFLPDEDVGRFLTVHLRSGIGISGDIMATHIGKERDFFPISKILDLLVSLFVSDEAKKFFESEDKEIAINLDDSLGLFYRVKMSKMPVLLGKTHWPSVFAPEMKIEENFFAKFTFDKSDNDFTFIIAQIEGQPVTFIRYRNICLSNLVNKKEIIGYKGQDNYFPVYKNKVIEHDGKEFESFIIDKSFHVFGIQKPFSFENIIIEI